MRSDVLPLDVIGPACVRVLNRELVPLHYRHLTALALTDLGVDQTTIHWRRQIERVREKLLEDRQRGTFYVPTPHCLGALTAWFQARGQSSLLVSADDELVIPGHTQRAMDGCFEALMRWPYMVKKNLQATEERRLRALTNLVPEKIVSGWFQQQWPEFFLPAVNEGHYEQPCDHDFRLRVNGHILKVDVTTPRSDGRPEPPPGKRPADLHLHCEVRDADVVWRAVVKGPDYMAGTPPEAGAAPRNLVVWLNCHRWNLDYDRLRQYANGRMPELSALPATLST